ncbi:MAG: hypothetical protein V4732_16325 [Pseudomonadota bacterium]
MRKKIVFAFGSVLFFVAVKVLAGTLLASPGYVASGCKWSYLGWSYGGRTSLSGLFCDGQGPILVKQVFQPPYGLPSCTMSASASTDLYTYSSPLNCYSYSVSKK